MIWETYDHQFGQENDNVLVVKGASRDFNPTIPEALVSEEIEKDEAKASSEYVGLFRRDIDAFVSKEAITDCLEHQSAKLQMRALRVAPGDFEYSFERGSKTFRMQLSLPAGSYLTSLLDHFVNTGRPR